MTKFEEAIFLSWYIGVGIFLLSCFLFKPRKAVYWIIDIFVICIPFLGTLYEALVLGMRLFLLDDMNLRSFDNVTYGEELSIPKLRNNFITRLIFFKLPWEGYEK